MRTSAGFSQPPILPKLTIEEEGTAVIPIGQRATILTLTSETCHFPIGDPRGFLCHETKQLLTDSFFICGGKAITGLPDPVGVTPASAISRWSSFAAMTAKEHEIASLADCVLTPRRPELATISIQ
jgi:hypothetical protein